MKVSWSTITVQQFQDICRLSLDKEMEEVERIENIISILYDMDIRKVDDLTMVEFKAIANHCSFVLDIENIPGRPLNKIKANGKKYSIQYLISKMRHRQYVETIYWGEKPIENMHLIMASIAEPITWYGKRKRNEVEMHKAIAADMLHARLIDVYHSCVFFCKLYLYLIHNLQPCLITEMTSKGITKIQATAALTISQNALAGYIAHEKWQPLKVSV